MLKLTLVLSLFVIGLGLLSPNAGVADETLDDKATEVLAKDWLKFFTGTWRLRTQEHGKTVGFNFLRKPIEEFRVAASLQYVFRRTWPGSVTPQVWCAWDKESNHLVLEEYTGDDLRYIQTIVYRLRISSRSRAEGEFTSTQIWPKSNRSGPPMSFKSDAHISWSSGNGKGAGTVVLQRINQNRFMVMPKYYPTNEPQRDDYRLLPCTYYRLPK